MELFCVANERPNYKKIWDSWSNYERYVYLWGLSDGLSENISASGHIRSLLIDPESYFDIALYFKEARSLYWSSSEETKKAINRIKEREREVFRVIIQFGSPKNPLEVIRDITTDLYKDPANSYIYLKDMCFLAFWKLKGKDIEPILIKSRKESAD